jgi:hypothetical protein
MGNRNDIFYINLPSDADPRDVAALLRHTTRELRSKQSEGPIEVNALYMKRVIRPIENEVSMMMVHYWSKDDQDLEREKKNKQWVKENKTTDDVPEIEHFGGSNLNLVVCRLPQGENQDNDILLIDSAAAYIERLKKVEVIDITFSDLVDRDALRHPELHIFYKNA